MALDNVADIYKLSPVQQGMLFHTVFSSESNAYHDQFLAPLDEELDPELFRRVWQQVIDRHTVLRTSFLWEDLDEPVQVVHRRVEVAMAVEDWSELGPAALEARLEELQRADRARGFDLAKPPLMRLTLIRGADSHWLMLSYHHILLDGWSVAVLQREVDELMRAAVQGRQAALAPARPFRDYIAWLKKQDLAAAEAYWRRTLAGVTLPTPLGIEAPTRPGASGELAWRRTTLAPALADALTEFSRRHRFTLPTVVQAAWAATLARYSGHDDVVYGVTVSGRPPAIPNVDRMIGCFINTLPMRVTTSPDQRLLSLLRQLQQDQLELRRFEHSPLVEVRKWAGATGNQPLFETIVVFEGFAESSTRTQRYQRTNYPLVLGVVPGRGGLVVGFGYDDGRFEATAVERLLVSVVGALARLVEDPEQRLADLPMLTPGQRQQLLREWNAPPDAVDVPVLHELVEARVDAAPAAVAARFEGESLAYGELDARANRLAHRLRGLGVGPEALVGVCLERSFDLVVALLAVLKAGGAYLPLDPKLPRERLEFMIGDAGAAALVTTSDLEELLPPSGRPRLVLDRGGAADAGAERPRSGACLDSPAYVIYTSGSTGRPKGVVVTHRAIAQRLAWAARANLDAESAFLQKTNLSFDVSVAEIFSPLLAGGRVVLARPGGQKDTDYLAGLIAEERITDTSFPPAILALLLHEPRFTGSRHLRRVITGGETVPPELPESFYAAVTGAELINRYGPTEATISATEWSCRPRREAVLPIGRPIGEARVLVVDRRLRLSPQGVAGEIAIGGSGLARGYLHRPARTAQSFVPHPFAEAEGERLYLTGDLARLRGDGALEFLGRVDQQVKIRGFRVELGEIENALHRHPAVRQAAVVDLEHGSGRRLAAYVVLRSELAEAPAALADFLGASLPDYMVPSAFVVLDELPLTATGKVDRRALPAPAWEDRGEAVAPRTPTEQTLAAIWAEVLRVDDVGVHDNFFALGGDSILSLGIVHRAARAGLSLSPKHVFEHQTIAELAAVVGEGGAVETAAEQGAVTGDVPLTPIQRFFFEAELAEPHHWNQAVALAVRQPLATPLVGKALAALLRHHDALRLGFTHTDEGWRQSCAPPEGPVPLAALDLSRLPAAARRDAFAAAAARLQASLALAGPVLRAARVDLGDDGLRLLLVVHHLVIDGVSWRVLIEDLETVCRQLAAGEPAALPPKTTSFKAWAERLVEHVRAGGADGDLEAWRRLAAAPAPALPVDHETGPDTAGSVDKVSVTLDEETTRSLLRDAGRAYRTDAADLLLAALAAVLKSWSGSPSALLALEGHGRETEGFEGVDLSRTVGWLTALYPAALTAGAGADPATRIKTVKEELRAIPHRGFTFGLLRYLSPDDATRAALAALPRPQVVFNYLGQFGQGEGGDDALFAVAAEPTGPAQSPRGHRTYSLAVNALVAGGRLRLEWSYSRHRHRRDTVETLARRHLAELEALLEHCLSPAAYGYTPSDFPLAGLDQAALDRALAGRRGVEALYPLSPMQEGMLFHSLYAPRSGMYFEQRSVELSGDADPTAFEQAWRHVVARHPSLRISLLWQDLPRPLQCVHREVDLTLERHVWTGVADRDDETARLEAFLRADRERGFDLRRAPLLRLAWITLPESGRHHLAWSFHHLLMDGWSGPIVLAEVLESYAALRRGETPRLPPARPYEEYVAWLEARRGDDVEEFWRRELAGFTAPTPLPGRGLRLGAGELDAETYATRWRSLPAATREELEALARRHRLTVNTVVQGAWALLLGRYSGDHDVVFGVTVSGRPAELPGVERMVGVFINTLPLRARIDDDAGVLPWLEALQARQVAAGPYEATPLVRIQGWSDVPRGEPLFESLLLYESYPAAEGGGDLGLDLEIGRLQSFERTNYPLTLFVSPKGELAFGLSYDGQEFEAPAIDRLLGHLTNVLTAIAGGPERRLADVSLLTDAERRQVLDEWNATAADYPRRRTLPELFAEQAAQRPRQTAAACGGEELTYGELDRRANRLAHVLRAEGVGPERRVGLLAERSLDMLVGLLGVLKAGGAYVPLDPAYPRERVRYVLDDADVTLLAGQAALLAGHGGRRTLALDDPRIAAAPATPPAPAPRPEHLAYVIYTSGSTGRPKGVEIAHRPLVNFLHAMARRTGFAAGESLLAVTTLSFDIAALELYLPLLVGARVVIAARETGVHGQRLAALLESSGATTLQATPATWQLLLESGWPGERSAAGLRLWCGGEALPRDLADRLLATGGELWNLYGPTETTIWSAAARVEAGPGPVRLGGTLDNTALYVLERRGAPAPIGVAGELLIGGDGLARGYFRRPGLTAERFVPHPFAGRPGERLYRTGDLTRRRDDGDLDFLGRLDHQVKVRGYRIELGEIEAALGAHPAVRERVVTARGEGGERRLVAYVVPRDGGLPPVAELRRFLQETLPDYMVPARFVELDALPLTPNGKVDRKALPDPGARREEAAHVPPTSGLERAIAEVWREVLEVERVGLDDNFFDLGGHSILAVRVHSALGERLGRELDMVDLFRYPTVRALAAALGDVAAAPARRPRRAVAPADDTAIAVIGMAGRFPGARDVEELWRNLCAGVESVRSLSREELAAAGVAPEVYDSPDFVPAGAGMDDGDLFDAAFFDYSPREAQLIDPQQRIFLEVAWEALEHAGVDPQRCGGDAGVFAGVGLNTYLFNLITNPRVLRAVGNFQAFISNDKDFLPTRVSYKLDLTGPSVNVQTACSTSLVATALACDSLVQGRADLALAGGVSINPARRWGYVYRDGGVASRDGHTRAFDARGTGTVFGDGAGVVVLKRLDDALADGDKVHAVIRGWAMNNDGSGKVGFTAPSVDGQARAIAQAQAMAGVAPETVGFVETHGTATEIGDPIEFSALRQAFGDAGGRHGFCALGAIKTNIGHVDTAAGVAGLIKTVLALERGVIPPSLNYEEPNPLIDFAASPFYVNTELTEWRSEGGARRAGVSSFGIGGTNAHLVLEEAPPRPAAPRPSRPFQLLTLSAKSRKALDEATRRLAGHLDDHPELDLADAAHTLQTGRARFPFRRVLVAAGRDDARALLADPEGDRVASARQEARGRPVVFMFPGGGAQYVGMGRDLYAGEPVYRREIDRCAELFEPHLGFDVRGYLFAEGEAAEEATALMRRTSYALPALFATEFALARLWISWGVRPQAMIGHSLGEYAAACLAGVLTLDDAVALVALRGQLFEKLPHGAMLSVPLPAEELAADLGDELSIAAVNTPALCVASGPDAAIDALATALAERGVEASRLHIDVAAHSRLVDSILEPFAAAVRRFELRPPRIPFVSNVTGTWITPGEATDPEYWPRQLRQTVRFADGLAELFAEPERVLLEVGPGQTLGTLARQHTAKPDGAGILTSVRHPREPQSDVEFQLGALGRLWLLGVDIDWRGFYEHEERRRVALPTYPFERQRYWIEGRAPAADGPAEPEAELAAPAAVAEPEETLDDFVAPRTPLEERLAGMWRELLGVERLGVHHNFFELGGSSLLAVQLRSQLRRGLGVEVPSHFLLESPTVARLAAALAPRLEAEEGEAPAPTSLVALQQGAAGRRPLYLMHPLGGHVYFYRSLAAAMGGDQPVYGLQAKGFEPGETPHESIETLAADYVAAILEHDEGPYLLGGSSMGGTIAYEMAQQLLARGKEVALLALMDTPGPGHMPKASQDDAELLVRLYSDRLPMTVEELRRLEPDDQLRQVLEAARSARALSSDFNLDDARHHLEVVRTFLQAYVDYQPRPYPGKLLFFRARDRRPIDPPHPELAWLELAEGVEVYVVPGDHQSMFHEEKVGRLAGHLRRAVDLARRSRREKVHA